MKRRKMKKIVKTTLRKVQSLRIPRIADNELYIQKDIISTFKGCISALNNPVKLTWGNVTRISIYNPRIINNNLYVCDRNINNFLYTNSLEWVLNNGYIVDWYKDAYIKAYAS